MTVDTEIGDAVNPTQPVGMRAEIRDAVSLRTVGLVIGVLFIQLAFVLSYVGAFHQPPRTTCRSPWWRRPRPSRSPLS